MIVRICDVVALSSSSRPWSPLLLTPEAATTPSHRVAITCTAWGEWHTGNEQLELQDAIRQLSTYNQRFPVISKKPKLCFPWDNKVSSQEEEMAGQQGHIMNAGPLGADLVVINQSWACSWRLLHFHTGPGHLKSLYLQQGHVDVSDRTCCSEQTHFCHKETQPVRTPGGPAPVEVGQMLHTCVLWEFGEETLWFPLVFGSKHTDVAFEFWRKLQTAHR